MTEKTIKIFHVNGQLNYSSWIKDSSPVMSIEESDLILFEGGADVNPSVYSQKKNPKTYFDDNRDKNDIYFFKKAIELNKPMAGVCRGAQFLTAMQQNGCLIQHVEGHAVFSPHEILFSDGSYALATSTHHQMMWPFDVPKYELIAWASRRISDVYEFQSHTDTVSSLPGGREPEIVYYPNTKCLAIQPHPEMMSKQSQLVLKLNDILKEKFNI